MARPNTSGSRFPMNKNTRNSDERYPTVKSSASRAPKNHEEKHQSDKTHRTLKLEILYEDNWVIVVNKPAGLLTIGYPGFHGKTALDILTDIRHKTGKSRPAVVHRLDRDTSGVMIFATSAESKKRLMDTWQESVTERAYIAVVENSRQKQLPDTGTITAPLAYNKYNVAFVPIPGSPQAKDAVSAVTHYRVEQRGTDYSLLRLDLETGRKNQIRAHVAYIGFPIAGDERAHSNPLGRLCLHARSISFVHPETKKNEHFEVPEPAGWKKLCSNTRRTTPQK